MNNIHTNYITESEKDHNAFTAVDELKNYISFLNINSNRNMVFFANSVSALKLILQDNFAEQRKHNMKQFLDIIKNHLLKYTEDKTNNPNDNYSLITGRMMTNALSDVMNILTCSAGIESIEERNKRIKEKRPPKPRYSNEQISSMIDMLKVTAYGIQDLIRKQENLLYELASSIKGFTDREVQGSEIAKLIQKIQDYLIDLRKKEAEIIERQIALAQQADDEDEEAPERHL